MADRIRTNPYGSYYYGEPRRESVSTEEPLGPRKTLLVLVVVVGCFAVLWPKVFYPMLVNSANNQIKPGPIDRTTGCCDVISDMDLDTIKIMSELCSTIIEGKREKPPNPKEIVTQCRKAVLETCGIDISAVLQERVSLGHSIKQILEEVRSLNGSLCLKYNFGVSPWSLGVSHRVHLNVDQSSSIRQERPAHLRPEMVHPAFKERGRAIPQPEASSRRSGPPPKIVEGRPGPIPGMRPAMGGPGHVVPPSKQSNNGFLGVLMPVYTIGFVVFFTYTIMKLVFKKKPDEYAGTALYPPIDAENQLNKEMFDANRSYYHRPNTDNSKIVVNAVSALLEEVNQELEARKQKMAETVMEQDETKPNGTLPKEEEKDEEEEKEIEKEEQGSVTVMGMETTASCEGGKKWSRPDSPVLPHPPPVTPKEPSPPPQQIFLEGSLPPQSQLLVSDSATETQKEPDDDAPVILAGKMTLSVISLDSETGTEDSSVSGKKAESSEGDRRSSGNTSDEFEKINASDLEEQINSIIEEAEIIALNDETRFTLGEELDRLGEYAEPTPHIDVLEEIKNQFNLEDDLIMAISTNEPEEPSPKLPVSDVLKDFLNNEESVLLSERIGISDIEKEVEDALREEKEDQQERTVKGLLSDEEKELIAKYQALEEEEPEDANKKILQEESDILEKHEAGAEVDLIQNTEENLQNDIVIDSDKILNDTASPEEANEPSEGVKITIDNAQLLSERFIKQEELALLNENPVLDNINPDESIGAQTNKKEETKDQKEELSEVIANLIDTQEDQIKEVTVTEFKEEEAVVSLFEKTSGNVEEEDNRHQESEMQDNKRDETFNRESLITKNQPDEVSDVREEEGNKIGEEIMNIQAVAVEEQTKGEKNVKSLLENSNTDVEAGDKSSTGHITPQDIESPDNQVVESTENLPNFNRESLITENQPDEVSDVREEERNKIGEEIMNIQAAAVEEQTKGEKVVKSLLENSNTDVEAGDRSSTGHITPQDIETPDNQVVEGTETLPEEETIKILDTQELVINDQSVIGDVTENKEEEVVESPIENLSVNIKGDAEKCEHQGETQSEISSIETLLTKNQQQEGTEPEKNEEEAVAKDQTKDSNVIDPKEEKPVALSLDNSSFNVEEDGKNTPEKIELLETETQDRKQSETSSTDPLSAEGEHLDELDFADQVIEDIEYRDESDSEELPQDETSPDGTAEERLNGFENDTSENELEDDDIEIEEVIEYVDNTDEEGEEIIEINGNQEGRNLQNHN